MDNLEKLVEYVSIPIAILLFGSANESYTIPVEYSMSSAYMKIKKIYSGISEFLSKQNYSQ